MKNRKWIFAILFILLLSTACSILGSGPGGTVQKFFTAVDKGEIEEAMSYLSSRTIQTLGADKWRAVLLEATRELDNVGGITAVDIIEENIKGETAWVTVEITYGDGSSETDSMDLIKEDGNWKIDVDPWSK